MVGWYNAVRENLFLSPYYPTPPAAASDADEAVQVLASGPDSQWAAIRQLYFAMIVSARRRICLQSPYFVIDASLAEALSAASMAGVAAAGAKVFPYRRGYLHAKTISIDGEICSIGSANIDIRSFSINYELNAVLYSDRLAQQLEAQFDADLEHCIPFDADAYRGSSLALRLRNSVARLLSPLLSKRRRASPRPSP